MKFAGSFALDFSKFKKTAADKKTTTLKHNDGHSITIAHNALSPKMREQLYALPMAKEEAKTGNATKPVKGNDKVAKTQSAQPAMMAEGGEAEDSPPAPKTRAAQDFQSGFEHPTPSLGQAWQNIKDGLTPSAPKPTASPTSSYARGGRVGNRIPQRAPQRSMQRPPRRMYEGGGNVAPNSSEMPDELSQIEQDTGAADSAPVNEDLARKRQFYNQEVTNNFDPMAKTPSQPNTFGSNGEAPQDFRPDAWQQAEQRFTAQQALDQKSANDTITKITADNKARVAAGLPPLQVPQTPSQTPPDAPRTTGMADSGPTPTPAGQPNVGDPYGTQAYLDAYGKGLGETKAGLFGEAKAEGAMGNEQAGMLQKNIAQQQDQQHTFQNHYDNLEQERQNFIHDVQNQHIDPQHYLNSMGTGQKIQSAIGLILGGFGAMAGQSNAALDFMNNQINRDIDAQKTNLGKSENLLSANMKQFGNMRDAADMTRVMQMDIVSNQLKQAAAKAMDPLAKARALKAAGDLDMQSAPVLSQMAMRKTLLTGMANGQMDPSQVIRMIVPQGQQEYAYKELQSAQNMMKGRDNLLGAFDQISKINTIGGRITSPLQTARQVAALRDPLLAQLVKDSEGRITPQDTKMIESLFPAPGDDNKTMAMRRIQLHKFISEKMNYPMLQSYGINLGNTGRYDNTGKKRIQLGPPKL